MPCSTVDACQVEVFVDPHITAAQINELTKRVKLYMTEESKDDWLQPAEPRIMATSVRVRAPSPPNAATHHARRCTPQ